MYPELFHIGNFVVFSYGFFIMLGVLMAFLFFYFKRKKINLSIDDISELFLWCFASVFVGGKLFYYLEKPMYFLSNPSEMVKNLGQGFVFYGSFLVTIPVLVWWFRKHKISVAVGFDYIAIAGALVHGFGKIGCFMAGCCHGIPCSPNLGVIFTNPKSAANPLNVPLYPVQLWDSLAILTIVAFMYIYSQYKKFNGELFLIYGILYGIVRFITENYRGDESRGYIIQDVLTHSQFIAVLVILTCFIVYVNRLRKHKISY